VELYLCSSVSLRHVHKVTFTVTCSAVSLHSAAVSLLFQQTPFRSVLHSATFPLKSPFLRPSPPSRKPLHFISYFHRLHIFHGVPKTVLTACVSLLTACVTILAARVTMLTADIGIYSSDLQTKIQQRGIFKYKTDQSTYTVRSARS
jgi:hypothetical protein